MLLHCHTSDFSWRVDLLCSFWLLTSLVFSWSTVFISYLRSFEVLYHVTYVACNWNHHILVGFTNTLKCIYYLLPVYAELDIKMKEFQLGQILFLFFYSIQFWLKTKLLDGSVRPKQLRRYTVFGAVCQQIPPASFVVAFAETHYALKCNTVLGYRVGKKPGTKAESYSFPCWYLAFPGS